MWLNSIRSMIDDKPLSPIELLVLSNIDEETINASQVMEKLNRSTLLWRGAAGTLYPILHRLHQRGLLHKSGKRGTEFSRSEQGKLLLSRSLNPIRTQMNETNNYYLTLIELLMKTSPMGIHEFMDEIVRDVTAFLDELGKLHEQAKSIKDDSVEVNINFD